MSKALTFPVYYDNRGFGPKAEEYKNAIRREFVDAEETQLSVGDINCGSAAVEIKTVSDFLASITDERLRLQPMHMKENFPHSLVLVLGSLTDIIAQNIFNGVALKHRLMPDELKEKTQLKIHENSILGVLTSLIVRHKIPVMLLEDLNVPSLFDYIEKTNPLYPAYVLECIDFVKLHQAEKYKYAHAFRAVRYFIEKANDDRAPSTNIFRRTPTLKDQQIGLVSQLPGVGEEISVNLLTDFKTIRNLFNQTPAALMETEKVGPVIADHIHELVTREYFK